MKLIDIIAARLDAGTDSFLATLPSLQLKDVRIRQGMVHGNERMLTGGFYAEATARSAVPGWRSRTRLSRPLARS